MCGSYICWDDLYIAVFEWMMSSYTSWPWLKPNYQTFEILFQAAEKMNLHDVRSAEKSSEVTIAE